MTLQEINIRDPYVLCHEGTYYMYGTRAKTCWGKADGFDCYTSSDLVKWEGPFEIFKRPEGFWADQNFWAPECIFYNNRFYLVTTFGMENHKAIQILISENAKGPFTPISDGPITPEDWNCIDGTIFMNDGRVSLIFSHSFEDIPKGDMCIMELSEDLRKPIAEIQTIFSADEAPWALPVPFAKAEFGMDGDVFFTDGPTVHRMKNGKLAILWSSWSKNGYNVGQVVSASGELKGPWVHEKTPFFEKNGGHGMLFTTKEGNMKYVLHFPNDFEKEHPVFFDIEETESGLKLK